MRKNIDFVSCQCLKSTLFIWRNKHLLVVSGKVKHIWDMICWNDYTHSCLYALYIYYIHYLIGIAYILLFNYILPPSPSPPEMVSCWTEDPITREIRSAKQYCKNAAVSSTYFLKQCYILAMPIWQQFYNNISDYNLRFIHVCVHCAKLSVILNSCIVIGIIWP